MSENQNFQVKNSTSYAYQVARNIAIDMLRKQTREAWVDIECVQTEQFNDDNSNIETSYLRSWLTKQGVVEAMVTTAIHES